MTSKIVKITKKLHTFFCVALFIFFVVILFTKDLSALENEKSKSYYSLLPDTFIKLGDNNGFALIVEKSSQTLYVYDDKYRKKSLFNVTTGKKSGDKMVSGDKKTPEGVYFFSDIMEEKDLLPEYGVMALTTNYPNLADRAVNKNGKGIWLHATNTPDRLLKPYDTRGCVVALNNDMLEIAKYVDLQSTPLIIVADIRYTTKDKLDSERKKILALLELWRKAWTGKDIDTYVSAYSKSFYSRGMDIHAWKEYKMGLNDTYDEIVVKTSDIKIIKFDEYTVVSFLQNYRSDLYEDSGLKRLYLVDEAGKWKIFGEEWVGLPVKNSRVIATANLMRKKAMVMKKKSLPTRKGDSERLTASEENKSDSGASGL